MTERQFEIIITRAVPSVFGKGWKVVAQQLSLPTGRLDFMLSDENGGRHIVELKKGRATPAAVEQVLSYAKYFNSQDKVQYTPWVVAHAIPDNVIANAAENNVKYLSVSEARCHEIMKENGIDDTELIGPRRIKGVIYGGGAGYRSGLRTYVPNDVAFKQVSPEIRAALEALDQMSGINISSGKLQIVIHFNGIKLGGVNRKHRGGHYYMATGLVLSESDEKILSNFGFREKKMIIASKGEHSWWEMSFLGGVSNFEKAITFAINKVGAALGIEKNKKE